MSQLRNLIDRVCGGTTTVPDFVGRLWRETGSPAVRYRVVRQPELAVERRDDEPIADWIVVTQQPAPRQRVPIGAVVTLQLRPGGTPRALDLGRARGATDEAAALRGSALDPPSPGRSRR